MTVYATLTELKAALGITDTVDDAILSMALDAASRFIDEQCGRTFGQTVSETRTFVSPGTSAILRLGDVVSVSSVATVASDGTSTTMQTTAYRLGPANPRPGWPYDHLILTGGVGYAWWSPLPTTVSVTGVWGWPAIPADITLACIQIAARWCRAAQAGFERITDIPGLGRVEISGQMTEFDRMVLAKYSRSRQVLFA